MRPFGVVVLAAGGSRRMGRPKQCIELGGRTLVERSVRAALGCGATEVVVVLGSSADEVVDLLRDQQVRFTVNKDWQEGLGNSIAHGVSALTPDVEAVILTLADQPFVTSAHLRRLAETPGGIVATKWDGGFGPPCLFARGHFGELASLTGDRGAKDFIRRYGAEYVPLESAAMDVDTLEDLADAQRFLNE